MTTPLRNVDLPPSSSFEDGMPTLRAEIERLKSLSWSLLVSHLSGTCSLTMIGNNSNSSFSVSKNLCKDSWVLDHMTSTHLF